MSRRTLIAIGVIGAACVITASIVVAGVTRPRTRPAPAPADSSSSLDEAPEPVARTATTERAAPVQPLPAPRAVEVVGAPAHAEPPAELPDEPQVLAMLHDLAGSDPQRSLKLAREAVERFPDGPDAPEFEWNVVKALFNMGRLEEAKDEARLMVEEYPGTYFAGDVDHHLLHPPPNPQ